MTLLAADPKFSSIHLGDLVIEVILKRIKNVHLSVYPPFGLVRVAAPDHMDLDTIRIFALSKLTWIREQQQKLREQERELPREFVERESHYLWGRRYLLSLVERDGAPRVDLGPTKLLLEVRPGTDAQRRGQIIDRWYRDQIREALPALLDRWQPVLGVHAARVYVQRMKTRWGSCNPAAGNIRLNTELAKKPPECLEYILVHELVHLLEPTHSARFIALMDRFMPQWEHHRRELNRLPIRWETWTY